jgi:hypothetical protein
VYLLACVSWINTTTTDPLDAAAEATAAMDASRGAIISGTESTVELIAAYIFGTAIPVDDANRAKVEVAVAAEEVKLATTCQKMTAETSAPIVALSEAKEPWRWTRLGTRQRSPPRR